MKNAVFLLIAAIVYAIGNWLWSDDHLKELLPSAPEIRVSSVVRPNAKEFLIGEVLTLQLLNVGANKAIWMFDEDVKNLKVDQPQIEYKFFPTSNKYKHTEYTARVDSFFKDGDEYKSVYKTIRLQPLTLGKVTKKGDSLLVEAPQLLGGKWQLENVKLLQYTDGQFTDVSNLQIINTGNDSWIVHRNNTNSGFLGLPKGTLLTWAYNYKNNTNGKDVQLIDWGKPSQSLKNPITTLTGETIDIECGRGKCGDFDLRTFAMAEETLDRERLNIHKIIINGVSQ